MIVAFSGHTTCLGHIDFISLANIALVSEPKIMSTFLQKMPLTVIFSEIFILSIFHL